jgi:hypothetical protein
MVNIILGKSKSIIYRNDDEAISITVALRRLVTYVLRKSFKKAYVQ